MSIDVGFVYKEIAREMIRELFEYLKDKEIKIIIDDVELDITFKKLAIDDKIFKTGDENELVLSDTVE